MTDKPEIPPGTIAELDQMYAAANTMYADLVDLLQHMTEEEGIYSAMAFMGRSLDGSASRATLVSMVLVGMRRDMINGERRG